MERVTDCHLSRGERKNGWGKKIFVSGYGTITKSNHYQHQIINNELFFNSGRIFGQLYPLVAVN